jgi:hypothetical protein
MTPKVDIETICADLKYMKDDIKTIRKVLIDGNGRKPLILDIENLKVQVKILIAVAFFCTTTVFGFLINSVFKLIS